MTALVAQIRAEVSMTLRRGETLLLTIGIPLLLLVFFSKIKIDNSETLHPVNVDRRGFWLLRLCQPPWCLSGSPLDSSEATES